MERIFEFNDRVAPNYIPVNLSVLGHEEEADDSVRNSASDVTDISEVNSSLPVSHEDIIDPVGNSFSNRSFISQIGEISSRIADAELYLPAFIFLGQLDIPESLREFESSNGGLDPSDINKLPTRKYVHSNSIESDSNSEVTQKRSELNKECPICLTDYVTGDVLKTLPCCHEFHLPCIDRWLSMNHSCPACRAVVAVDS